MAARRLKFKPKPLIGLVRRNKDANDKANTTVTNEDLRDDSNQSLSNKDESDPLSENLSTNEETRNINQVDFLKINLQDIRVPGKEPVSLPEPVLEEKSSSSDSNTSASVHLDHSGQFKHDSILSNLKDDINNKIKTVILNSRVSSVDSSENGDHCITTSYAELKGNNESGKDTKTNSDIKNNCTSVESNSRSEQNASCMRQQSGKDKEEIYSVGECRSLSDSVVHEKTNLYDNSIYVKDNLNKCESDKKDHKHSFNGLKISSKFGKARFKPVLSNIIRKKDAIKLEESSLESHAINLKPNFVEELSQPPQNEVTVAQMFEKETVENSKPVEECSISNENASAKVTDKVFPVKTSQEGVVDEPPGVLLPDETENEQSVRSPVKLFQPKKRQRSQGALLTNLTYKAQQDFKDKFKDGNVDKSKLMMRDLIFYNPKTNPMPERPSFIKTKKELLKTENNTNSVIDDKLEEEKVDDINDDKSQSSMPVPQVKVGPDGKIILDPKSLVIEATGIQKGRATLENSEVVQENEFSYTKYYKRRVHRSDWSAEETLLFYKALNDLGADFSLMQSLFPKKTRRDLKLKFKKEERINSHLIDKAMRSSGNFDFTSLENELKKDREERERKLQEQRVIKEHKKKERLEKKALVEKNKERKLEELKIVKEFKEKLRLEKKADKEKKLEELKIFKECKRKERLERKGVKESSSKLQTKRKSSARKEMDGVDIKKENHEDKINRILTFKINSESDVDENNFVKKNPRNRKSKKQKKYKDESAEEDNNLFDAFVNSSSDDGIVSDFIDEENENLLAYGIADLNPQIFKKTRSGRQPKLKLLLGDSLASDNLGLPNKKLKMDNGKQTKNVDLAKSTALDIALSEFAREFSEESNDIVVLSEEEIQKLFEKRFDKCYKLFEEPLDLSHSRNLRDDANIHDDNDCSNCQCDHCENNLGNKEMVKEVTLPVIDDIGSSEIFNTAFASPSNLNSVSRNERNISESLQIMEELTSSEVTETRISSEIEDSTGSSCGVVMFPNNEEYILPNSICEERDFNNETTQSDTQSSENSRHCIYSLNDSQVIENAVEDQQNIYIGHPPIFFSNLPCNPSSSSFSFPSGSQIQVIPQEQINYIIRQSPNTRTDSCDDDFRKEIETNEPISHSQIHCYPSSDHTYTSLVPKPVEQKNTYLLVTQMDSQDSNEHLHATIVVYPSSSDDVS